MPKSGTSRFGVAEKPQFIIDVGLLDAQSGGSRAGSSLPSVPSTRFHVIDKSIII
jgi:hypothetical protein